MDFLWVKKKNGKILKIFQAKKIAGRRFEWKMKEKREEKMKREEKKGRA